MLAIFRGCRMRHVFSTVEIPIKHSSLDKKKKVILLSKTNFNSKSHLNTSQFLKAYSLKLT